MVKKDIAITFRVKGLWKIKIFLWLCRAVIPFLPSELIYKAAYNFVSSNLELEIE